MAFKRRPSSKTSKAARAAPRGSRKEEIVLLLGDDGAIVTLLQGGKLAKRLFATGPDQASAFIDFMQDRPNTPVSVLVDTIDQSYVRHTLPPVTSLSLGKLVKRRLERDFAPDDLKGALPLGREEKGRKDWHFLLANLPASPQLAQWLGLIERAGNRLKGIYLLPVEASLAMQRLFPAALGKTDSQWRLLVSHQKVGGFRQVVTHKGKLVFTRLSQPLGDPQPEVVAGQIDQEIQSTREYLKRLNFNDQDGIDIAVIASAAVQQALAAAKAGTKGSFTVITPLEAAEAINLPGAALPEDHYGDVVLSVAFGNARKRGLRLLSPAHEREQKQYQAATAMRAGGVLLGLLLVAYGLMQAVQGAMVENDIGDLATREQALQQEVAAERSSQASLPENSETIADVVKLYNHYTEHTTSPLILLEQVGDITGSLAVITEIGWSDTAPSAATPGGAAATEPGKTLQLELEFLQRSGSKESLFITIRDMLDALERALPAYEVTHSDLPGLYVEQEVLEQDFSVANRDQLSGEPVTLGITIAPTQEGGPQ